MKNLLGILGMASMASGFVFAQGIEGTVKPIFDPARELQAMQMVPVCAPGTPVIVKGTKFACGTMTPPPATVTIPNCAAGVPVVVNNGQLACGTITPPPATVTIPNCEVGAPVVVNRAGQLACSTFEPHWAVACMYNFAGRGSSIVIYYTPITDNPTTLCTRKGTAYSTYVTHFKALAESPNFR